MSIIFKITLIFFIIKIVRDILFFVWLWQIKEYRPDRMISHLKNDRNMKDIGVFYLLAVILLVLFFIFPDHPPIFSLAIAAFFLFPTLCIIKEIADRSLRRPKPTFKVISIFIGTFVLLLPAARSFSATNEAFSNMLLLLVYILMPSVISSVVLAVNPIFDMQKKRILRKAADKMRSMKKVRAIGITGSYGKTSTKEFLFAILSRKFKVAKTEGNNNTNIGVAYTVLNKVSDDLDFFICEMGAYKIGEIKEMCEITKPEIGILTGINEQHIELFGGIENTIRAKFELIEALPENGLAIINANLKAKNCMPKIRVRDLRYFSIDMVNDIKIGQDHATFVYKDKTFRLNLPGRHYIENLISAIMVSESLGMTLDGIKDAVSKIKPTEYLIRKLEGNNGSIFIDDSYSANPDGVSAALDYIKEAYPNHKKIIVFPGFIELGNRSEEAHRKLFKRIDEICDIAYILDIRHRILDIKNKCRFVFEKDFNKAADIIKNDLDKNTIVLFESRGAGVVMKKIQSSKWQISARDGSALG